MNTAPPASPELERFARDTLGCHCAPEVFQRVEEDLITLPGLAEPVRRIAIGGRLLLYLIPVAAPDLALARIGDWAAAGLAERERRGMNRVRLVLGLATPTAMAAAITDAFDRLPARDERLHLHLLPAAGLPGAAP